MSDCIINYSLNIWNNKPEKGQQKILLTLLKRNGFNDEKSRELLDAYYYGAYHTRASFMAEYVASKLNVCEEVLRYINFDQMARDHFVNDFFALHDDFIEHIFSRI